MTSNLDKSESSHGDRDRARTYVREFVPAMLAYVVVLALVLTFGNLGGTSPLRFLWALLPVLPLLWVGVAVTRHLRRLDDYQQRLTLQAICGGFVAAMGAAVAMGLLDAAGLQTRATAGIVFGAGMCGWGITSIVVGRRA